MKLNFFLSMVWATALSVAQIPSPTETLIITSAPPASATAELYIFKADTNAPGLSNPVLVVEGFDLDNSMNWPELYELLNQENLVEDIRSFGRDLVVLNFTDSTLDIHTNSAVNGAAIKAINERRTDLTDKFTAVGASLGGLTLRQALVTMTNHMVDAWISFDVPHEGANIPLGVQEYLEFFAGYNDSAASLLTALDSPAARQMLIVHHTHPDGLAGGSIPERADYISSLASIGYPTNCKSIAISNGSGLGEKQPFSPGEKIINWTDTGGFLEPDIDSEVFALPQNQGVVFSGEVRLLIPIDSATVNAYHPLPLDNAPGGTRATFLQLYTNIPPDQISADDYCNYTNHCFIPTVSALGIPLENIASNLFVHSNLLGLSPFDEIHFATNNEEHVEINPRNKRWIIRSILEDYDSDGDGVDDYKEFLVGTAYDSAESKPVISAILTVPRNDLNAELTWIALPNISYAVWYTDDLLNPWLAADTFPPVIEPRTNSYTMAITGTNLFFKITGHIIDPANN